MAENSVNAAHKAAAPAKAELRLAAEIPARKLSPEALRALAEAAARRQAAAISAQETPEHKEINGPAGPEPTRYGDWERKGIISDF
jgi:hypothetical protein